MHACVHARVRACVLDLHDDVMPRRARTEPHTVLTGELEHTGAAIVGVSELTYPPSSPALVPMSP